MGFSKIASMIAVTVMLTVFITFTATKKYLATQESSAHTCADEATSLAASLIVEPHALAQPVSHPPVIAEDKNLIANQVVAAVPQAQKVADMDALIKEREAQQQHIDAFRKFVAADHKKPVVDEVNLRYEAEAVDYQWAAVQEGKLLSVFADSESLASYVPSHMSCRSATCKITIPSQDDASADAAYHAVWQSLIKQNPVSNDTITYFRNQEKGEVVMYISTQEKSIFQ
jgi:hypothetical protein